MGGGGERGLPTVHLLPLPYDLGVLGLEVVMMTERRRASLSGVHLIGMIAVGGWVGLVVCCGKECGQKVRLHVFGDGGRMANGM